VAQRPDDELPRAFGREAFGADPAAYDAVRPGYPAWVFDELVARGVLGAQRSDRRQLRANPGARCSVTASRAVICSRSA
jgi:hypothetical protein